MTDGEQELDHPPPIDGGAIAGRVTDFEGVPLTGVRVEAVSTGDAGLSPLPALTDGDGQFRLEGLGQGRYDVRFMLGRVKAKTLAVPTGTDQLQVKLARPQGILLVLRVPQGPDAPDLVHFCLERETPVKRVREHVGRMLERRFLIWNIRPGRYVLSVWGGRYLPVIVHGIDVVEGEPAPVVEVAFSAMGTVIEGRIEGGKGPALVSWRRLDRPGHAPQYETTQHSDDDGTFAIRGLPEGRYRVSVYDEEAGAGADIEVDVPAEGSVPVSLSL